MNSATCKDIFNQHDNLFELKELEKMKKEYDSHVHEELKYCQCSDTYSVRVTEDQE